MKTRAELIALQFVGAIDIPTAGFYTFFTSSDDGSAFSLQLPEPSLQVIGKGQVPPATRIVIAKAWAITKIHFGRQSRGK